jgi:hypothetical protein
LNGQISRFLGTLGRSRRFTRDEENRAFCSLEQFRRQLTEEKLVARPRAYTQGQETVTADIELTEKGFLRVRTLRTAPFTSTHSDRPVGQSRE